MSTEQNRTVARRFFEEQDRNQGPLAGEICAPHYTAYIGSNPPMNITGHSQFGSMFYAAFPDLYHTIEDVVAQEDKATVRFTLRGTHQGNFMGIPASNKKITVSAIAALDILDGKVTQLHAEFDQVGLMQQLGALPASGQGTPS